MGKLLTVVLALAAIGFLAYFTLYGRVRGAEPATPKERLDNVNKAADRIEAEQEQRLKDVEKKMDDPQAP